MSDFVILLSFGLGCAVGIIATLIYWPWIAPQYFGEGDADFCGDFTPNSGEHE